MLTRRQESKVQEFLGRDQYGFRSGRGTRDTIAALRVLYERTLEFNNKVYICYVDFEKAFDRIDPQTATIPSSSAMVNVLSSMQMRFD